jgi:hypothetical protein
MSGAFIDDFVSNAIDTAIAAIGSEGEGQGASAPQHEMQIMVNAPHLASCALYPNISPI